MGLILSMVVLSAIGDITRFSHPKKLVSYAGISPGVHTSGETNRSKPITITEGTQSEEGRKELRWAMVEAAWVRSAVTPTGRDSSSVLRSACTKTKPRWPSPAECWFPSGTSLSSGNPTTTSMKKRLPIRCSSGLP
ncbi:MAG: IS110 family transposase, partial [Anaerolineales bacterium]|nr:IS110 family transposase [Anaerolineales bacterium]